MKSKTHEPNCRIRGRSRLTKVDLNWWPSLCWLRLLRLDNYLRRSGRQSVRWRNTAPDREKVPSLGVIAQGPGVSSYATMGQ